MSWLSQYLELTATQESPELFHFWSAVSVLGHVLGRRVWINQQLFRLYPAQIMVVLVSESAVTRKSSAAQAAIDFLQYLPADRVNKLPNKLSPAVLIDALRKLDAKGEPVPAIGFVYARELGTFFTKESFAETLATHITDLNDAPNEWIYETHTSGKIVLLEPCIGMLGCTTPTGLAHEIPKAAQTAGFFGRLLIIYQDQPRCANDLLDPLPEQRRLREWLIRDLIRVSRIEGELRFEPDAREWYRDWYSAHVLSSRRLLSTMMTDSGYYGRKHAHLLRVATVLLASRQSDLLMDWQTLDSARMALETVEALMPRAHSQLGASPMSTDQERIIATLERHGQATYRQLYKRLWRFIPEPDRFRICIKSLMEAQLLDQVTGDNETAYRLNLPKGRMLHRVSDSETSDEEGDNGNDDNATTSSA